MGTQPTTVIGMPRPTWTPTSDEQRDALAAIDRAVAEAQRIRAKADAEATNLVVSAILAARQLGVPVRAAVERTDVSRATVYRLLGKTEPDGEDG